jgi:hypothetical protein
MVGARRGRITAWLCSLPPRSQRPRWAENGRAGSLEVPAGCPLLIVEGDGAGRREVAHLIDALVWVQPDEREAERRRLARDREPDALDLANQPLGGSPPDHAGGWPRRYRSTLVSGPGERADVIVCGTPEIRCDPSTEVVVGGLS